MSDQPTEPLLTWEDPPTTAGRPAEYPWHTIAAQLRERPGEWACLGRMKRNPIGSINAGRIVDFRPAGTFEAVGRNHNHDDHTCTLYIRFVGDPS